VAVLRRRAYPVHAPANPLRGSVDDSACPASVLAATGNSAVRVLVHLAGYARQEGGAQSR
jgi:hypothetical protein